jgi:exosortase
MTPVAKPPTPLLARLSDPTTLAMFALVIAGIAFLFHVWFFNQHRHSWGNADWSHAYFVPLVSIFLLWQVRDRIQATPVEVFWPGFVPLLAGVISYIFFLVGAPNHLGQGLALILTVFGVCLLLLGPRMMPLIFFPIAFLFFAVTIPEKIMNFLTYPLQDLAARGGYVLLNMVGVKTDIQGNVLLVVKPNLETHPLNVAEQCAGMRTVVSFVALGVAVGLVAVKTWWKRVVLVALGVPVALLLNIVRIAVLGFLSLYNSNLAAGQAHMFIGTLLLIPGFLLFLGVLMALNIAVPEPGQQSKQNAKGALA